MSDGPAARPVTQPPDWYPLLLTRLPGLRQTLLGSLRPQPGAGAPRHAAVLVLFGDGPDGPDLLLTERSADLRSHAGQVAFPGGTVDPGDGGPAGAALREAAEEAGVDPAGVEVGGLGPQLYMPITHHLVTPVVAWWARPSPVSAVDPREVARAVRVPLAELLDPANRFRVNHPSGLIGPGFSARELFVWGFTAGILDRLLRLAGLERSWDADRIVRLPALPSAEEVLAVQAVPDSVPDNPHDGGVPARPVTPPETTTDPRQESTA